MLRLALEAQGHTVVEARDQPEAEAALAASNPAVVLSDLRLTEGDGFGVLRAAKELDPELPVIVMTAFGSIQDAVAAMKEGALDFLAKPVDPDHLLLMVERALIQRRLATENMILKEELAQRRGAPLIVGDDAKLKQVSLALHRAAATDTTVLLEGESGTGKELFARALHALSPRNDGPFVAINCAAIPENLLETELFGHEKGRVHRGVAAQARQVRARAPRHAVPRRDRRSAAVAAGQDPARARREAVRSRRRDGADEGRCPRRRRDQSQPESGSRGAPVPRGPVLPAVGVSDRDSAAARSPEGHPDAGAILHRTFCRDLNKAPLALSPAAEEELVAYAWPGNVRELQNCIERAVILTEGDTIHPRHLSLSFRGPTLAAPVDGDDGPWSKIDLSGTLADAAKRTLLEVERRKIVQALKEGGGNPGAAAEILQVSFKTLTAKIKEHGIE